MEDALGHGSRGGAGADGGDASATLAVSIRTVRDVLGRMTAVLNETTKRCDPRVFYARVRLFLNGWNHAGLPKEGVEFRGVPAEQGPSSDNDDAPPAWARKRHNGASAAQSALLPAIDAFLNVRHPGNEFLAHMREYMPRGHREYIALLERECAPLLAAHMGDPDVAEAHAEAVQALHDFRSAHIVIVTKYIVMQSKNGAERGTGGSDLIPFLKQVRSGEGSG